MPLNAIKNKGKGRTLWSYDDNSKINIVKSRSDKRGDERGKWGEGGAVMIVETSLRVSMLMWPKVKTLPWR